MNATLEHDLHVVAVNRLDISRMRSDRFMGYGKPKLDLVDGRPVVTHVPVPERPYLAPFVTQNLETFTSLRSAELVRRMFADAVEAPTIVDFAYEVAIAASGVMDEQDREHGSRLIIVWLPLVFEHGSSVYDAERKAFLGRLEQRGISTIDLVDRFRAVPPAKVPDLFLDADDVDYPGAAGHYSAEGNQFFGRALLDGLRDIGQLDGIRTTNRAPPL